RSAEKEYSYSLRSLSGDARYRVRLGGSESRWYNVSVVPRPAVMTIGGIVTPPEYTRMQPYKLEANDGAVRAPIGSRISLSFTTNHSIVEAGLTLSSGQVIPCGQNGRAWEGVFTVKSSGTYVVSLLDGKGNANENPLPRPVECVPDALPKLKIVNPAANMKTGLDVDLDLRFEARDDYGLDEISLYFVRNRLGEPQLLKSWKVGAGAGVGEPVYFSHPLRVTLPAFDVGDVISVYAEATDHGAQEEEGVVAGQRKGRSQVVQIEVINPEKVTRKYARNLEKVYQMLEGVLKEQKDIHSATAKLPLREDVCKAAAASLYKRQATLRTTVLDASGLLADTEEDEGRRIRTVLRGLAANELADASSALWNLSKAEIDDLREMNAKKALPAQAQVIFRLRQILAIVPEIKEKEQMPAEEEAGEDIPPEVEEAAKKLQEGLEKFKAEQKKILEATEDLAKKDVDDYTEEDKKKLEELRAAEENLRNFLKDVSSDLSKIPPQDFSNPSLLGETITVLEEVELAEGAMTAGEVEIATTAATTGVELAESMTTHLEKWLSDKPDRTAWKMEEPLSDYDTPMSELPDKLEDIVGDLLEDEEDLMSEAEDTSSSWADSLDKGAGWDAADGPISNYSAQGVTGNALPNDTEIGGRAGEGRQGKSGGEMVSDTAVGKGGRKTPSRLTPDSFEAGEINDQSKDASGGSTGGGKGGAGGAEGLEGPPPPQENGPLPRLLGKQAELRNRAERVNLNLKLMGYNTSLLENTLAEMKTVEQDMKSGRCQSAFRKKHLLIEQLRNAKDALVAEAEVRADRAEGLPRDIQRELMDATEAGLPEGYEDLDKDYYEKLAEE
ncbi:MAG: hypothetical protein JXR97_04230, partial [Planctomycetes bacterium]|nr:hypothetical protein [Planctomycetota bacterium]